MSLTTSQTKVLRALKKKAMSVSELGVVVKVGKPLPEHFGWTRARPVGRVVSSLRQKGYVAVKSDRLAITPKGREALKELL